MYLTFDIKMDIDKQIMTLAAMSDNTDIANHGDRLHLHTGALG